MNYRGVPVTVEFIPKLQIELTVKATAKGTYTGHPGDGRIVVLPVEKNTKIRDHYEKCDGGRG